MEDPPPLTPDQQAQALALYRHLLSLRRSGERLAVVHLDDDFGVRPVGKRVDVGKSLTSRGTLTAVRTI